MLDAVSNSGYPLQSVVAGQLPKSFHIEEEWVFLDKNTGEERTIDIPRSGDSGRNRRTSEHDHGFRSLSSVSVQAPRSSSFSPPTGR